MPFTISVNFQLYFLIIPSNIDFLYSAIVINGVEVPKNSIALSINLVPNPHFLTFEETYNVQIFFSKSDFFTKQTETMEPSLFLTKNTSRVPVFTSGKCFLKNHSL